MKLECAVVQDLYVLYTENELSPEVKQAVTEHLKECSKCKEIYDNETGFNDITDILTENNEEPSKYLDEKIMLKLKIKKFKIALVFVISIFIVSLYQGYKQSRENLYIDFSKMYHTFHQTTRKIDNIKTKYSYNLNIMDKIMEIQDEDNLIRRNLNYIEKKPNYEFKFHIVVNQLFNLLKTRYVNDSWSEKDEKVYIMLSQYFDTTSNLLKFEVDRLSKIRDFNKFNALILPVDVKKLSNSYDKITELAVTYTRYNKLPNEISPLSKKELEKSIKKYFDTDNLELNIYDKHMSMGTKINGFFDCTVELKDENIKYLLSIDSYTGKPIKFNHSEFKQDGELLPLNNVTSTLKNFLKKHYGNEFDFNIKYLGINHNYESNVDMKLYSYTVYPKYKGFKVSTYFDIYCDARTGALVDMDYSATSDYYTLSKPFDKINTDIKFTPSETLAHIKLKNNSSKENYIFAETFIAKSKLNNKYILIYTYKHKENNYYIYINPITGKQEVIYK